MVRPNPLKSEELVQLLHKKKAFLDSVRRKWNTKRKKLKAAAPDRKETLKKDQARPDLLEVGWPVL